MYTCMCLTVVFFFFFGKETCFNYEKCILQFEHILGTALFYFCLSQADI